MSRLVVAIGHVEFTGGSQVLYVVKVQQDADEWEVRRTYSDFRKLRDDVQRVMKDARAHILDDACSREFARELQELPFPAKRLFGSRKDHVVKERAVELHRFLIKLLFLTHTYRKAQKARYDQYVQALPSHQQAAYAALQDRTQASVSVFYLLRDFLKPVTIKTDVPPHSGDLLGSSDGAFHAGEGAERESSPKRLIRESKILAMRSSNPSERKHPQSAKEATREADKMQQQQRREQQVEHMRKEQHKQQQQQQQLKNVEAVDPANDSGDAGSVAPRKESPTISNNMPKTAKMNDLLAASERSRAEANSLRQQFLQKQHSASVAEESLRDQFLQKQHSTSALANEHRMQRHYSTPDGNGASWKNRTARAATSTSTLSSVASSSHDESEPEKEKHIATSSVPSSTSSTASKDEVKLVDLSSLAQYKTKKSPRRDSHSSDKSKSSHQSSAKEEKVKSAPRRREKKTSRVKRKAKSAKNLQMTDSERMSRVSSALNAQAISINAQRELEKYISEYSAIMILRYVDRFINKAVMKAPGCYRVNAQHRLVIDSQRFLQEIEDTFTDLPINFGDLFQTDHDEWAFPPALDRYVQLKWDSFQSMGSNSISLDNGHSSAADQTSDSDDSDTEYEYEEVGGGGYMTAKQTFSNDEESMLQEMIANGTAGREQMLRLRRQMNEQGWNRRENPGSRSQRVIEEASSSESDDEEALSRLREKRRSKRREPKRSVSCVVEKYQQEQNARRKDRLQSFGGPIGGFV
ncbi:Phox homologous domain [Phytophthora cinnamomi]|uniref:Phox homologous domain n=1 Tax=Phytophthora cinnamomi TaxID=4785 RepID=UPI003559CA19|nr:Phox homologous domain [Phytophthora cinnamomi]